MSNGRSWMLKWRIATPANRYHGDFRVVLSRKRSFRSYGFESLICSQLWDKLQPNDMVFCYQTDRRSIVGIAAVVRKGLQQRHLRYIDLRPLECFQPPVPVHNLKQRVVALRAVHCLKPGPIQTIYSVSAKDRRVLSKCCGVINRSTKAGDRRNSAVEIEPKTFLPADLTRGKPVKLIMVVDGQGDTADPDPNELALRDHLGEMCEIVEVGKTAVQVSFKNGEKVWAVPEELSCNPDAAVNPSRYAAGAAELAERLLDRHNGDFNLALEEADLATQDSQRSGDRLLMKSVYDLIMKKKCGPRPVAAHLTVTPLGPGDEGIRPGSYCSCGGNNKDCFLCGQNRCGRNTGGT